MLARPLFDEDVALAEADPASYETVLHAEEAAQVERAVEKRKREFATGRGLARRLLSAHGVESAPLLNDPDRAPIWPERVVGSISHTHGYCGVVVAPRTLYAGLGLDVEQGEPLKRDLVRSITREEEREALARLPEERALLHAKAIFSAKEAAYKAQYALSRTFLGFSAMRIELDLEAGSFRAVFAVPAGSVFLPGDVLDGRIRMDRGLVACGVAIAAGGTYDRRRCDT